MTYPAASVGHVLKRRNKLLANSVPFTWTGNLALLTPSAVDPILVSDTRSLALAGHAVILTRAGTIPTIVDSFGAMPSSAGDTLNFAITLSGAVAGMKVLLFQSRANVLPPDVPTSPSTFVRLGYLERASTTAGSNYTIAASLCTLVAGDISGGVPNILTDVGMNQFVGAVLISGAATIVWSMAPMADANTANNGFNRSADILQNSIASVAMTPSGTGALALNIMARGGGLRTVNAPSTWSMIVEGESAVGPSVTRNAVAIASKTVAAGVSTGTANWTVDGAADMRLTDFTALLQSGGGISYTITAALGPFALAGSAATLLESGAVPAAPLYPNSIASIDMDMIFATDPSTLTSVTYLGFLPRPVERQGPNFDQTLTVNTYVYRMAFSDCPNTVEMIMGGVNPRDGSTYANEAAARVDVDRYTPRFGKLPTVYKRNIAKMYGYSGNGTDDSTETLNADSSPHYFTIYADRATTRIANNDLEESFFHEGTHASIQRQGSDTSLTLDNYDVEFDPAWIAAKAADGANGFITQYAIDGGAGEDIAEHALFAYTMLFHPERIPEPDRSWIAAKIPNRIAYFSTIFGPAGVHFIPAAPGTYALVGSAATLSKPGGDVFTLDAAPGTYALVWPEAGLYPPTGPIGTPTNKGTAGGFDSASPAAFTPAAGETIYVACGTRAASPLAAATISDTASHVWVQIADVNWTQNFDPYIRLQVWRTVASGAQMDVTVSSAGNVKVEISITGVTGVGSEGTVAVGNSTTGDPSATVAAVQFGSAVLAFACVAGSTNDLSTPTGYTTLSQADGFDDCQLHTVYDTTSPGTTVAWSSAYENSLAVAFEIKAGPVAATNTLSAALGAYALAGSAATLSRSNKSIIAAPGTYALVRSAATLLWSGGGVPTGPLYASSVAATSFDFIHANDPNAFVSAPYLGFLVREVPGFGNVNVHVFGATFNDCPNTIEMYMTTNPEDESTYANQAAAQVDVDRYTPRLGKLPLIYRRNIHHMIGYAGNGTDDSGETLTSEDQGHFFMIFADRATTRIANNDLEESFFHEGTHASIQKHGIVDGLTLDDYDFLASPEWAAAKAADGANGFITTYATTQDQEDFAEHALFAYTMIFHPERFPEPDRTWIAAKIPNRIAFFRTIFDP